MNRSTVAIVTILFTFILAVAPRSTAARADAQSTSAPQATPYFDPTDPNGPIPTDPPQSPSPTPRSFVAAPKVNLTRLCPALNQSANLVRQAEDADAIAQFDRERVLRGQVALAYFHCAQHLGAQHSAVSAYGHDVAMLAYAQALKASLPTKADDASMQRLTSVVADLAAHTKYSEVTTQAQMMAAKLPTPAPTTAPPDPEKCQGSGFADALQNWKSAYSDYANSVNSTNRAGAMKNTWLNQFVYAANQGSESGSVQHLMSFESQMNDDIQAIRDAGMPQSAVEAEKVLAAVHTADGYAASFTADAHRGMTGINDRNALVQSRLNVDTLQIEMEGLYCKQ